MKNETTPTQWVGLLCCEQPRPVEWQVGKTYKTTLDGVTATIARINDEYVYGRESRPEYSTSTWEFHTKTGGLVAYEASTHLPHLTPYLADEPEPSSDKQTPVEADPINPPHYQQHPSGVECIQVTEHMSFCVGNAVKYLWLAGLKGDALTDLRKAKWYIGREIERIEKMKGGAT